MKTFHLTVTSLPSFQTDQLASPEYWCFANRLPVNVGITKFSLKKTNYLLIQDFSLFCERIACCNPINCSGILIYSVLNVRGHEVFFLW